MNSFRFSFRPFLTVLGGASLISLSSALATNNPCELPFTQMQNPQTSLPFEVRDAVNSNRRISEDAHNRFNLRHRFLVVNLDTKDSNGQCKGLTESYPRVDGNRPPTEAFPELSDREYINHFLEEVQPFYSRPAQKNPVVAVGGTSYCIGQTVSFCEIRGNRVVEIMRLGTSSLNRNSAPDRKRTYGELNSITHRSWMTQKSYSERDGDRDEVWGGVDSGKIRGLRYTRYTSGGNVVLANFLKWDGLPGFEVPRFYGGLHELSRGETNVNNLGAPVSHGCLRLTLYGSVLARWWTPLGARMFVHYTDSGYRQRP